MMPIDNFIQQLILSGLADSFLDAIEEHYLKLIEAYNIISDIEDDNINGLSCSLDKENDILVVCVYINKPENICEGYETDEFSVQICNNADYVNISVINNYRNEADIYESRFARYKKTNNRKWS